MKIAVLGAGIMGVSCGIRLLELFNDKVEMTLISEAFSPNTTSDVSAGYWKPYCLDGCSDNLIRKWGKETYDRMLKEALSKTAAESGVQVMSSYVLNNTEEAHVPFWSEDVAQFRVLNMDDIKSICAMDPTSDIKSGFTFTTTTVIVNKYIPFLMKYLVQKGAKIVQKKLATLKEFLHENDDYDYVINCVGLGALQFCGDTNMRPVRGQVIRVKAPWVKSCVILEHKVTYILPLSDIVVLGGTQEPGEFGTHSDNNVCEEILENCCKLLPSLKDAEIVEKQAGLRPLRVGGIRLEMEIIQKNKRVHKVIHNYGHGGSGITLCWGCANEVCDMIATDLKLKSAANL